MFLMKTTFLGTVYHVSGRLDSLWTQVRLFSSCSQERIPYFAILCWVVKLIIPSYHKIGRAPSKRGGGSLISFTSLPMLSFLWLELFSVCRQRFLLCIFQVDGLNRKFPVWKVLSCIQQDKSIYYNPASRPVPTSTLLSISNVHPLTRFIFNMFDICK